MPGRKLNQRTQMLGGTRIVMQPCVQQVRGGNRVQREEAEQQAKRTCPPAAGYG